MKSLQSLLERFGGQDGFFVLRDNRPDSVIVFAEPLDSLHLYLEDFSGPPDQRACLHKIESFIDDKHYSVGYFAYEFLHLLEKIPTVPNKRSLPIVALYKYSDKIEAQATLEYKAYNNTEYSAHFLNDEKSRFESRVSSIKEAIRDGNVYQVNLSRAISAQRTISPLDAVSFLNLFPSARYGAFGSIHSRTPFSFLSLSPELFFRRDQNKVIVEPIKGTASKSNDPIRDKQILSELLQSSKDRAELAMIVDLYRNDLGKVALPGTVRVKEFPSWLETDSLFHLFTEVECVVPETTSSFEIFCNLFPSGSITGAPKIAAIEHIAELEGEPRNIYCGAIGYFGPGRFARWNVAIRTVSIYMDSIDYRTGGGITIDSNEAKEFQETVDKSIIFYKLISNL